MSNESQTCEVCGARFPANAPGGPCPGQSYHSIHISRAPDPDAASESNTGLVRSLTLIPAAAIVLSNVIGTGVFIKARVMICNVGTPWLVLAVLLVAGLLSLTGAMVYAELSAMMPRTGGEYNFLGAAYARSLGFLFVWTRIIAVAAANAAIAIAFAIFFNDLFAGTLSARAHKIIPFAVLAASTLLNLTSARSSALVN